MLSANEDLVFVHGMAGQMGMADVSCDTDLILWLQGLWICMCLYDQGRSRGGKIDQPLSQ